MAAGVIGYGSLNTESPIIVDLKDIKTNTHSPLYLLCRDLVVYFLCPACLLMIIYSTYGRFTTNMSDDTSLLPLDSLDGVEPISDLITAHSSRIENCASSGDESCDAQHGCNSYEQDIAAVLAVMVGKYYEFENVVLHSMTDDFSKCLKGQFTSGKVKCISECSGMVEPVSVCKNIYLDQMKSLVLPQRRSCIASLMAREFSTLCGSTGSASIIVERMTFDWWAETFGDDSSWVQADCPSHP